MKQVSRTALSAAMYRAAHQLLEGGGIFADPHAIDMLPPRARDQLDEWMRHPARHYLRLFIAMRSNLAERAAADAIAGGVRQIVMLGAGLDTLLLRNPFPEARLFEVDLAATQDWKRARLAEMGADIAPNVSFVCIDFETEALEQKLGAAGFDQRQPAIFLWLGVVLYLTESAIRDTLRFVGARAGNELVFDYFDPLERIGDPLAGIFRRQARNAAVIGEPFVSYFTAEAIGKLLLDAGATRLEDFGPRRLFADATDDFGAHVIHARFG